MCDLPSVAFPHQQAHYHLGIFSSASDKTVKVALELLEQAAGVRERCFGFMSGSC
jgi:hypothetical protein